MTWYTASAMTAIRAIGKSQTAIPVFEDFFLVEAHSRVEALKEAERIAREHATLSDGVTVEGVPAERVFLGIRKLRSVYNPAPLNIDEDRPTHGTELTNSYFEVSTFQEAQDLAKGKRVRVSYIDDSDD